MSHVNNTTCAKMLAGRLDDLWIYTWATHTYTHMICDVVRVGRRTFSVGTGTCYRCDHRHNFRFVRTYRTAPLASVRDVIRIVTRHCDSMRKSNKLHSHGLLARSSSAYTCHAGCWFSWVHHQLFEMDFHKTNVYATNAKRIRNSSIIKRET